jgi:hypothetical protein
MAEETLVSEPLTDAMIRGGATLLGKLDDTGVPITAALWYYFPNEWRLVLASPDAPLGPKNFLQRIQHALSEIGTAGEATPLRTILVTPPNHPLIHLLGMAIRTDPKSIGFVRFHRNTINGQFIHDALIYRIAPAETVQVKTIKVKS